MPAVVVPDLKQKFALLRSYPSRSWTDLAGRFGKSYKTLQFWQDGSSTRDPGLMPDWALPILMRLVGEILPDHHAPEAVRAFVFGPTAQLEEELRTGVAISLMALLTAEAHRDSATLIRRGDAIDLVEVETEDRAPCPRLRLGESFRIVVRPRFSSGYAVALQNAQRAWALLPTALSPSKPATILVPGVKPDNEPRFMSEPRDPGRQLFVCLELPAPPPASLEALDRDRAAIDKRALDALATFYAAQPRAKRACHMLEVEITTRDRP